MRNPPAPSKHFRFLGAAIVAALVLAPLHWAEPAQAQPVNVAVAVLPLANIAGNATDDALAEGMSDDLGGVLAKVPGLHVSGRASAFRFKSQPQDIRAVAQALKVSHVVQGTFQKTGTRIHLSLRLLRTADGTQVWSRDYDTEFAKVFDLEDDVATSVAESLKVSLPVRPGETLVRSRTSDMEAYEDYLRAKPLIRARGQKPFADAAVLLQRAVVRDPDFAPASALLAFDYDLSPLYQLSIRSSQVAEARQFVDSVIPKAESLAKHATERDPTLSDAFVALAYANLVQFRPMQAEDLYKKALALDGSNTDALHGYSQLLAALGRVKESIVMRGKLQALEPYIVNYVADTAEIIWLDGDSETAVKMLNDFRPGRTSELAQVQAARGNYHDAANVLREMNPMNYGPGVLEAAARLLESAPTKTESPETLPKLGNLGFVYLHLSASERVMEYYEANFQAGYFQPISSTWFWHPSYAPVRKLDRFKTYMKNIGFVDYWRARGWPEQCHPMGNDFTCG
jgi:TolB-like protein/tetratricopeptide (TPR) repeat protein